MRIERVRAGGEPERGLPLRQKPKGVLSRIWSRVLDFTLVLWVVRVPLVSVVLGLAMMAGVTQAQDVTLDVAMAGAPVGAAAGLSRAILSLVAAVFLLWAMPVHYAARLLVETDSGLAILCAHRTDAARSAGKNRDLLISQMVRQVPRILGTLPFVAMAVGTFSAIANLPALADQPAIDAAHLQLVRLGSVMLGAAPVFYAYTLVRDFGWRRQMARLDAALGRRLAGVFRLLGIQNRPGDPADGLHATGRVILFAYAALAIFVMAASPHWLAAQLPLAFAVPLIFGGWVPILSYLSSLGRRIHAPLIISLFTVGAISVYVFGDNHGVRTLTADKPAHLRTSLAQAIHLWMQANGCVEEPDACPRPVIVAAAGGASRASFFTASVIGHFLDFEQHRQAFSFTRADGLRINRAARDDGRFSPQVERALIGKDIASRIFAISGVSGGSYGAAVVAAALGARAGKTPPCPSTPPQHWFGGTIAGWRDCLESMTGGDYLTATFFGLSFHDQVQLFLRDRAALLEEAWEESFSRHVADADGKALPNAAGRMAAPFLGAPRDPARWVPFLVLNGTSMETGQRIVTTDLLPTFVAARRCPSGGPNSECPIFTHAIDFHGRLRSDLDVRLSTAVTNSARFPVISPPGTIYLGDTFVTDRIVDGGYFENFGAESALELAQAIVEVEPRLAPFIIVISNGPEASIQDYLTAFMSTGGIVYSSYRLAFAEVAAPMAAVGAVRSARGQLAMTRATNWLDAHFDTRCPVNLVRIKVWPEAFRDGHCLVEDLWPGKFRDVSMSWWLSKLVQMNLHAQLDPSAGRCNNRAAVEQVWKALATRSDVCTDPAP